MRIQPVDLVFAVDSSGSMANEMAAVQARLNPMVQQITAAQIDVRVVLLTAPPFCIPTPCTFGICVPAPLGSGTCPDDSKAPGLFHSTTASVQSNNGAVALVNAFSEYRSVLRPSSLKHLIIFSDDDSTGTDAGVYADNAARFVTDYSNLDPSLKDAAGNPTWRMSGMYGQTDCPNAASVGRVWKSIIDRTGGVHGDLCACPAGQQAACDQAVSVFANNLAMHVTTDAKPLSCEWNFPPPPSGQTLDLSRVNLELIGAASRQIIPRVSGAVDCNAQSGGWYFDNLSQPSIFYACPATCNAIQTTGPYSVTVAFGCATISG